MKPILPESEKVSNRLLDVFPPHTEADWKEAAIALLKGAPFEKRLITPTYEGFSLQPIYTASEMEGIPHLKSGLPGMGNRLRGSHLEGYVGRSWLISQELNAPTPKALNAIILHELSCGQNELNLWLDSLARSGKDPEKGECAGDCGVSVFSVSDIETIFEGVELGYVSLFLRAGGAPLPVLALLAAYLEKQGIDRTVVTGAIEVDPISYLLERGVHTESSRGAYDAMAAVTRFAQEELPELQTIVASGDVFHNGGASSVQELGYVLASAVESIRQMQNRGIEAKELPKRIRLSLSIGPNSFLEIAKLRAARLLWSRILDAYEIDESDRSIHIHGRTGLWNKTRLDPYVNMLRTTTEAFSAVIGGVDSLHVGCFDEVVRASDDFSRRIARNTHHILGEECDLTKVIDPAGGSWAVEKLTQEMAEQAWKVFQEIEVSGGMLQAVLEGVPQRAIESMLVKKRQAIGLRRDVVVGTNNYPNPDEKALDPHPVDYLSIGAEREDARVSTTSDRDVSAVAQGIEGLKATEAGSVGRIEAAIQLALAGGTLGEIAEAVFDRSERLVADPILLARGSAEYEALRERIRELGVRSEMLQINYGPSRRYRARADWTSAFFGVGGYKVTSNVDFESIEAVTAAVKATEANILVITSDDETYGVITAELAAAIKQVRPDAYLILAGMPGENESVWREAGVDDFVHVRVSNYAMNSALAERLEA